MSCHSGHFGSRVTACKFPHPPTTKWGWILAALSLSPKGGQTCDSWNCQPSPWEALCISPPATKKKDVLEGGWDLSRYEIVDKKRDIYIYIDYIMYVYISRFVFEYCSVVLLHVAWSPLHQLGFRACCQLLSRSLGTWRHGAAFPVALGREVPTHTHTRLIRD